MNQIQNLTLAEATEHYNRALEVISDTAKERDELKTQLQAAQTACAQMREALSVLYEETADYIRINHLGKVHHNQSMKLARKALRREACDEITPQ